MAAICRARRFWLGSVTPLAERSSQSGLGTWPDWAMPQWDDPSQTWVLFRDVHGRAIGTGCRLTGRIPRRQRASVAGRIPIAIGAAAKCVRSCFSARSRTTADSDVFGNGIGSHRLVPPPPQRSSVAGLPDVKPSDRLPMEPIASDAIQGQGYDG